MLIMFGYDWIMCNDCCFVVMLRCCVWILLIRFDYMRVMFGESCAAVLKSLLCVCLVMFGYCWVIFGHCCVMFGE